LITGTFDVANYGDLLFPLIAQHNLPGIDVIPVSPTSGRTVFRDALPPTAIAEALSMSLRGDAVLIGGGYIIHDQPAGFLEEYRAADAIGWAYPSLWLGATLVAAMQDIPVLWNAPGAPFPFARPRRESVVRDALRAATYVSVRDAGSATFLGQHD